MRDRLTPLRACRRPTIYARPDRRYNAQRRCCSDGYEPRVTATPMPGSKQDIAGAATPGRRREPPGPVIRDIGAARAQPRYVGATSRRAAAGFIRAPNTAFTSIPYFDAGASTRLARYSHFISSGRAQILGRQISDATAEATILSSPLFQRGTLLSSAAAAKIASASEKSRCMREAPPIVLYQRERCFASHTYTERATFTGIFFSASQMGRFR